MLEKLKDLVGQYAGDAIINNPAIPNERNEEAVTDASTAIIGGLKTAAANGDVSSITNLFNGSEDALVNSPIKSDIEGGFINNLMAKFGLDKGKASQIAGALIPVVLTSLVKKTNDPSDKSFDLGSILSSLTPGSAGANGGDLLGKIKGMFS